MDRLKADLKAIEADPWAFWVGGGDYADHISRSDRRFDPTTISADISVADLGNLGQVLVRKVRDLLKPIAHKSLGLVYGNHEKSYMKETEQEDLHAWLCTELDVPNLQYCSLFDLSFIKKAKVVTPTLSRQCPAGGSSHNTYRFFIHHGAGSSSTPGGKLNRLIQFMQAFEADIYLLGHVHDQKGQRLVHIGANASCTKLVEKHKIGIISGGYIKTYASGTTSYGEQRGYAPVALGASFVRIMPYTRQITAEV